MNGAALLGIVGFVLILVALAGPDEPRPYRPLDLHVGEVLRAIPGGVAAGVGLMALVAIALAAGAPA